MENEPESNIKEEIYSCPKCHCPISSSLSVRTTEHNYYELLNQFNSNLDPDKIKCIFILQQNTINSLIGNKYNFDIDLKNKNIICKNDKEIVGFIRALENDDYANMKLIFGYMNMDEIEITEVGFRTKKEIPVYSQEEYTVLAKLKQLRYYVKQLTPTLKTSMELMKKERANIYECQDKFDKYKLNMVINKFKEIQKKINDDNETKKDK